MKIVRLLHPYCIPVFGYIAGGDLIGMPDNIADAMVAAGYAEWPGMLTPDYMPGLKLETTTATNWPKTESLSVSTGGPSPIVPEGLLPTESPMELHKSKRTKLPVAEDAPAEEN